MGHGGCGSPSIVGSARGRGSVAKLWISSFIGRGAGLGSSAEDEWCAVFGTVGAAFDGFVFVLVLVALVEGGGLGAEDGKCLFLYLRSTLSSIYSLLALHSPVQHK